MNKWIDKEIVAIMSSIYTIIDFSFARHEDLSNMSLFRAEYSLCLPKFSVLCLLCLCACLFICALWSPAGKGLTSWLSFVVSTVSL